MKRFTLVAIIFSLFACGKKSADNTVAVNPPDKATLTAPLANSACIAGTNVTATQSDVLFSWGNAANANSYDLYIKNLLTNNTSVQTTTNTQITVTLPRATPFSWYVISKSNSTSQTTQSDVFKFFNAGAAKANYSPFPADLITPTTGQSVTAVNGKVTLTWKGTSIDNNIASYSLYTGSTVAGLTLFKANLTATTYDLSVNSAATYYWQIVTIDAFGDYSLSEVHQFAVN
jgi:hypothetical protein